MSQYVALLRGINVGGRKQVPMAALRAVFEEAGFTNVRTLLATGNVIFDTPENDPAALNQKIEEFLEVAFGFEIGVILRTMESLQKLVASGPFDGIPVTPDTRLYVTFLGEGARNALEIPYASADQNFRILSILDGALCSVLTLTPTQRTTDAMNILEKAFGKKITTRNWNTVVKIVGGN